MRLEKDGRKPVYLDKTIKPSHKEEPEVTKIYKHILYWFRNEKL